MPNGKPGHHPLTDILVHRLEVSGAAADSLIRQIYQLGGEAQLERRLDLLSIDPRFPGPEQPPLDLAQVESKLR